MAPRRATMRAGWSERGAVGRLFRPGFVAQCGAMAPTRSVPGFRFGAVAAGLKTDHRPDLALAAADEDVPVAAVFTRNRVKGAPVVISQERVKPGVARALLVHAGNANACTGRPGLDDQRRLLGMVAQGLAVDERRVLAAGTGRTGVRLPLLDIEGHVGELIAAARGDGFAAFSEAILTDDRTPKVAWAEVGFGRIKVRLLGCAKGSRQVGPNLATTLAFVFTDASVDRQWLRGAVREEADLTFNDISVDGEASSNDSLFVFASGRAQNQSIDGGPSGRALRSALRDVLEELAAQVVGGAAGVTRVVTLEVAGAPDLKLARHLARRVGNSPFVKAALHHGLPDWGRIVAALGNAGVDFDPERVDIHIGDVHLVRAGAVADGEAVESARAVMARDRYTIRVHLHGGHAEGRVVTGDLSADYLREDGGATP